MARRRSTPTLFVSDPACLIVLEALCGPREYEKAFDALPSGGHLAVALRLDASSRRARLPALLSLRFRTAAFRRRLTGAGTIDIRCFGLCPDLAKPDLAYELGSAAERYAERALLPRSWPWPFAILSKGLRRWAGCHPSVTALLIVGRKP